MTHAGVVVLPVGATLLTPELKVCWSPMNVLRAVNVSRVLATRAPRPIPIIWQEVDEGELKARLNACFQAPVVS